nr:MAG TPA: hypothetical protein [Caudoviricetes sp.]
MFFRWYSYNTGCCWFSIAAFSIFWFVESSSFAGFC